MPDVQFIALTKKKKKQYHIRVISAMEKIKLVVILTL